MAGGNRSIGYGIIGVGAVFAYAALINRSVIGTIQDLVAGKKPSPGPGYTSTGTFLNTLGSPGATVGATNTASGNVQGRAQELVTAKFGAAQWPAFVNLEMSEAGWNTAAKNPKSGALGLAQALGHGTSGTAGSLGNEYGGYGLSTTEAQQANSGAAEPQLKWMLNYVASRYGTPARAWAFHLAHNYY